MQLASAKKFRDTYDCVIAGAGPAGLNAGRRFLAAAPQASLLLVDKSVPWQRPKPCAEGVGKLGFHEALPVDQAWVRTSLKTAVFHAPSGRTVAYSDQSGGYIIDRARMQHDLADGLAQRGAHLAAECGVASVSAPQQGGRVVTLADGRRVTAAVVVDAAGASSPLGKDEGICWKAYDSEPAIFVIAEAPGFGADAIHVFMSEKLAPGGYCWVFPSAGGRVNAGVLVGSRFRTAGRLSDSLKLFLERNLPGCRVVSRHAGAIACGYERWPIALPGLLKAGDAASTTNPISRGGIVEALHCGAIAGEFAARMLGAADGRALARLSREYEKAWYEKMGKRHLKLAAAKLALAKVPDADYDAAVETLSGIPQAQMTMARIFRAALMRFPRLIWSMRHLM